MTCVHLSLTSLINNRYCETGYTIAAATAIAGGGALKVAVVSIEKQILDLETKLFRQSKEYRDLIELENCRKRLQRDTDKKTSKRRRSDTKDESEVLSATPEMDLSLSQSLLERDRFAKERIEHLEQLLESQEKRMEALNQRKITMERIFEKFNKLNLVGKVAIETAIPNAPQGEPRKQKHDEARSKELSRSYGIGFAMLSRLSGARLSDKESTVITALGKSGQGIRSPVNTINSQNPWDKSGLGAQLGSTKCNESSAVAFVRAATVSNVSSTSTSVTSDTMDFEFGQIHFTTDNRCRCLYKISTTKNCTVSSGAYGVVFSRLDHTWAYKITFCQDIYGDHVDIQIINDKIKMRKSHYMNALYESKISSLLEKRNKLKDVCVFVNSKFSMV